MTMRGCTRLLELGNCNPRPVPQTTMASVYTCLFIVGLFQATLVTSFSPWPYLQIYPPVNKTDSRTPLYFAVVLSFGGEYTSIGALPGVQIALDYINSQSSILPGYTLHYTLTDSQCNHSIALDSFYKQINFQPTKVGWVGSGCSPATEPTAELTQFYNITQLSCLSTSPELANRQRYKYLFRLLSTELFLAQGFLGIIKNFGWKRVSIIVQDENIFTATAETLKEELSREQIEHIEKRFRSDDGIDGITTDHFEPEFRVFVLLMYSANARDLFCEAYRRGIRYPEYMLITYGWYLDEWWIEPATSSEYNCTAEERATVLQYTLAAVQREYPTNPDAEAEPDITASQFMTKFVEAGNKDINQDINLTNYTEEFFLYSYHCHEATIALAYALNQTIADLNEDITLNREAAEQNNLPEGENFTMANFTYNNSVVVSRMFKHLENTMFDGVSGNKVVFNKDGTREVDTVAILQYQFNNSSDLVRIPVATVSYSSGENEYSSSANFSVEFPDGIPSDGIPIEEVVTVSVALTVVYVIFATAGLVFAVLCLVFTLIFRKRRLIRLSSPNLNYIIGLGAIILYLNVITFVIPTIDQDFAAVLCNINPWLTSLGFSLCYGTILMKMFRVWIIFNRPQKARTPLLQDHYMALFVLCLVIIDLIILGVYTVVESIRGNLGVKLTINREMPEETIGPTAVLHKYFIYVCESDGQVVVYAFLYGCKGLLQVIALILAFSTRKVKVKGLNDSIFIAVAIYITSIVLAVTTVSTYTLMDYVNVYPAVVGLGFLLGTTMILGLVFVPRMVGLYKDPNGDKIKFLSSVGNRSIESETNIEVKQLRKRVTELENSLRKYAPVGVLTDENAESRSYQLEKIIDENSTNDLYEKKPSNRTSHSGKNEAVSAV